MGCLIEPRNIYAAGAEAVSKVERNMCNAVNARCCHPAGVEEHITCKRNAPEAGRSCVWPGTMLDSGPHRRRGAVVDDAQRREVGPRNSSCEAGEQGGAICRGVG